VTLGFQAQTGNSGKVLLEANVPLVHTINTVCYDYVVVDDKFFPFLRTGIVRVIN